MVRYLKSFIRKVTNGSIVLSPDISNINPDIWKKCKLLSDQGFVIGGSVVLKLYGLIERDIDDIDVFLSENIDINIDDYEDSIVNSNNDGDGDDYEDPDSDRFKIHIDGVGDIDIFKSIEDYSIFYGVKINSPFTSLKYKIRYNREKDIADFKFLKDKYAQFI